MNLGSVMAHVPVEPRANNWNKWFKLKITLLRISTGRRQTSWLFTSAAEEAIEKQIQVAARARLEPGTAGLRLRHPNHAATNCLECDLQWEVHVCGQAVLTSLKRCCTYAVVVIELLEQGNKYTISDKNKVFIEETRVWMRLKFGQCAPATCHKLNRHPTAMQVTLKSTKLWFWHTCISAAIYPHLTAPAHSTTSPKHIFLCVFHT